MARMPRIGLPTPQTFIRVIRAIRGGILFLPRNAQRRAARRGILCPLPSALGCEVANKRRNYAPRPRLTASRRPLKKGAGERTGAASFPGRAALRIGCAGKFHGNPRVAAGENGGIIPA